MEGRADQGTRDQAEQTLTDKKTHSVYPNAARVTWSPTRIFNDEIRIIGSFSQLYMFRTLPSLAIFFLPNPPFLFFSSCLPACLVDYLPAC
jgi:hypothetical protein